MIDSEEAPSSAVAHRAAFCGVCGGPLPATRYVHVDAWSVVVLCSPTCLREIVRRRRRVRWSARLSWFRTLEGCFGAGSPS